MAGGSMVGNDFPRHGRPMKLSKPLTMFALWATGSSGSPVLFFDIVAFSALIVVVINVLSIWLHRMKWGHLSHVEPSPIVKVV